MGERRYNLQSGPYILKTRLPATSACNDRPRGSDLYHVEVPARSDFHRGKLRASINEYTPALTPVTPMPPFTWSREREGLAGVREVPGCVIYFYSMNYLGLLAGNAAEHLTVEISIGVQIVGRRFREGLILDAFELVERCMGLMAEQLWARG